MEKDIIMFHQEMLMSVSQIAMRTNYPEDLIRQVLAEHYNVRPTTFI
jgi:hypothetical protein